MGLFDVLNGIVDALSGDAKETPTSERSNVSNKPANILEQMRSKAMNAALQDIFTKCYSDIINHVPDAYARNLKEYTVNCNFVLSDVKLDREMAETAMLKAVQDALKSIGLDNYSLSKNSGTFNSRYGGSLTISWE